MERRILADSMRRMTTEIRKRLFMLLAIDIGNTQTVLGLYDKADNRKIGACRTEDGDSGISCADDTGISCADDRKIGTPAHMWRIATVRHDTADDIRCRLSALLAAEAVETQKIDAAVMASVVPQLGKAWDRALQDAVGIKTLVCSAELAAMADLFDTSYPRPDEIGADRVADAIAARALFGSPVIVIDFGTATNIEVIDAKGSFIGGIIAPGVETGAEALFSRATRLAQIDLVSPEQVIGTSTEQALRSGIVLGEAERADGLIRRVREELGYTAVWMQAAAMPHVIATGGLAPLIAAHSHEICRIVPELTLEGLRMLAFSLR